jgi:hypothetical protein
MTDISKELDDRILSCIKDDINVYLNESELSTDWAIGKLSYTSITFVTTNLVKNHFAYWTIIRSVLEEPKCKLDMADYLSNPDDYVHFQHMLAKLTSKHVRFSSYLELLNMIRVSIILANKCQ